MRARRDPVPAGTPAEIPENPHRLDQSLCGFLTCSGPCLIAEKSREPHAPGRRSRGNAGKDGRRGKRSLTYARLFPGPRGRGGFRARKGAQKDFPDFRTFYGFFRESKIGFSVPSVLHICHTTLPNRPGEPGEPIRPRPLFSGTSPPSPVCKTPKCTTTCAFKQFSAQGCYISPKL